MATMNTCNMIMSFLASFLYITSPVYAQIGQSGFISIDCGASADYTDADSGINYVTDTTFVESGVNGSIASSFRSTALATQYDTLRSFPNGTRNCYTVRPSLAASTKFLIRARFMYGNYDGLNMLPTFDLYLGTNLWFTIQFVEAGISTSREIIVNITSVDTSVCLVNTRLGTPFISALELRPMKASLYAPIYGALALIRRHDHGSYRLNHLIRYKEDTFDRLWASFDWLDQMNYINTSLTVDTNVFNVPSVVMQSAITPKNVAKPIGFFLTPPDPTAEHYVYMHFAELQVLQPNQTREFDIILNGSVWHSAVRPKYLSTTTIYSENPKSLPSFEFDIIPTVNSTLPPILNAIELYEVNRLLQSPTSQDEVDAMKNVKSLYGVSKNWQGDPCAPRDLTWNSLNCSFSGYQAPKITYLNLSSSGLNGEIPAHIGHLLNLKVLDLSNNNLNGTVPSFLAELAFLTVLNLAENNLSGSIPSSLLQRSEDGLLSLSVTDNVNLVCVSTSCTNNETNTNTNTTTPTTETPTTKKGSSSMVVPITAAIAGVAILIIIVGSAIWFWRKKKAQAGPTMNNRTSHQNDDESNLEESKQVTYYEVQSMTNNFQTVIGNGGFGSVYKGFHDGAHVAVKMLSSSSSQGYKEFHAEVKLLLRVHHRNLTSLVGYCNEPDHKALIYEYMVNGDLASHLSAKSAHCLTWEERLGIGLDSAQGLEYLHNGCKPPIVHRDVKTANILLNETFQAKIADFGLSRVFSNEGGTDVSTVVAGTPGYLDPEYYISNRLHEKSDVFSFGVVLLEIITSRAVIARNQQPAHIGQWVSNMLEQEGDVRGIIDPRLRDDYNVNSVWKAVEVATACVSQTSAARPTMTEVVTELKECLSMESSRLNSRATISSNSVEMASLSYDTGLSPVAR